MSSHFFALMSSQSQQLHAITIHDFHIFSFYLTHHKDFFLSFLFSLQFANYFFIIFSIYLAFLLRVLDNKFTAGIKMIDYTQYKMTILINKILNISQE
jgi:hypothetical protein